MTAGDIKPGDRVRWWPDGHDDEGRVILDRYIDGIQLDRGRSYIQVTGSHGFTERWPGGWRVPAIGGVVDTSVSPGTIQRLNPAPKPYAPGEKLTDRHPDSVIARVVEETIEKHNAIDDKLPGGGSSTFSGPYRIGEDEMQTETPRVVTTCPGYNAVFHIEPDPPDLAERRATRVAEHQRREMQERAARGAVHAAGIRLDGFDQHQVDAAKAALLAPAPPRYPRRTR